MKTTEERMREVLTEHEFKQFNKLLVEFNDVRDRIETIKEQLNEEERLASHVAARLQKYWARVSEKNKCADIVDAVNALHEIDKNRGDAQ